MSDIEPFFNSAEECADYERFCAEQERGLGAFELAEPALVCRWRMARRKVPLLNRHIRALSQRLVSGEPLTTNMLSWAKQHVEWSLDAGDYRDPNGVLMLVIDINGDALMSVGPYEPLADVSRSSLEDRAERSRVEAASTRVAPEVLCAASLEGGVAVALAPDAHACGAQTLVEQLSRTLGLDVERLDVAPTGLAARVGEDAVLFLVSDEHGVVLEADAPASAASEFVGRLAQGVAKLFA